MAEVFDLLCGSSSLAPKSKLLRRFEVPHGLVPKLSHHCGKNNKNISSGFVIYITSGLVFFSAKRGVFASDAVCVSE